MQSELLEIIEALNKLKHLTLSKEELEIIKKVFTEIIEILSKKSVE